MRITGERIKAAGRKTFLFLAAFLIFLSLLSLLGSMEKEFGPFQLSLGFSWGLPGESRLIIPPLGEVKAHTHHWPVVLSATLKRIDLALLQHELMGITDTDQYLAGYIPLLKSAVYLFLIKLVLVGGVAGGLVGLLFGRRSFSRLWRAAAIGALSVLLILGGVTLDYDQKAFTSPRYEGALEAAPWILTLIDQGLTRLPELNAKLSLVAGNLNRLFSRVDELDPLARVDGELKVLQVTDIHNNPASLEFINRVIEGFGVDLVIDTGDLTDYGTILEAELMRKIKTLNVRYLFIPGNHDSPEVIAKLEGFANVRVLRDGIFEFQGLRVAGWGDPASQSSGLLMASDEAMKDEAAKLADFLQKTSTLPDILAVHNRRLVEGLTTDPPVILYGHDHRFAIEETKETVYINAGSSGAAGLRGLENDALPYSVALLRFDQQEGQEGYQLVAVDLIHIYSLHGKFIIERKVLRSTE